MADDLESGPDLDLVSTDALCEALFRRFECGLFVGNRRPLVEGGNEASMEIHCRGDLMQLVGLTSAAQHGDARQLRPAAQEDQSVSRLRPPPPSKQPPDYLGDPAFQRDLDHTEEIRCGRHQVLRQPVPSPNLIRARAAAIRRANDAKLAGTREPDQADEEDDA